MISGVTPLLVAITNGYIEIVKALLAKGANPNQGMIQGVTPLYLAVYNGQTQVVNLLLDNGAQPNQVMPNTGEKILDIASKCGHFKIFQALVAKGASLIKSKRTASTAARLNQDNIEIQMEPTSSRRKHPFKK